MQYPALLTPITSEPIQIPSGQVIDVPCAKPVFQQWDGEPIQDTYRKTILKYAGQPVFAELLVLKILKTDGWDGVWVDTFGHANRTEYWPKNNVTLPAIQQTFLDQLFVVDTSEKKCWDVFAWKEDLRLFVELKRETKDHIRPSQKGWLQAGLQSGLPITAFLIVQWSIQT